MLSRPQLLTEVWREACRHIDIAESTANIAKMLGEVLPAGRLLVRNLDRETRTARAVASGGAQLPGAAMETVRLAGRELERLCDWAARRVVATRTEALDLEPALARILPPSVAALVGGLATEHGANGVLILQGQPGAEFDAAHIELLRTLLDPFAAALDNHHRLHELTALREAAEAERRSLLARLGRQELSGNIVGGAGGLRGVMERIALVRGSDVPVLILGETGSGKEVVAREIHERSQRSARPFIRVNCGALPPELIDSELFGHEKGAFTGASAQRRGWFERADTGTLLLDEIGELPLPAQVRLLRVLQDGLVQRVGGEDAHAVDVRIIAATHRDLPAMVQEGRFREDLWYRLAVFPIVIPPLRERREDIPALAEHFARRAAQRFGLRLQLPGPADLALLADYAWPGNVREVAAVIDRAAILGNGQRLDVATALGTSLKVTTDRAASTPVRVHAAHVSATVGTLDEAMRHHIEAALSATQGRVEGRHGAAALLAINPHTLRARMRKLGIDWGRYRQPS